MARSISFTVSGDVETRIRIEELPDGTLRFDVQVLGAGLLGDLRGMFFDLGDVDADTAMLSVVGIEGSEDVVGETSFAEEGVERVEKDVNLKGEVLKEQGAFDVGIEFGTQGIGKDDISSASFILSADVALSLDSLDLADFGLRYTSVGDEIDRSDSSKIAGDASGVARNDAWEVDENSEGTVDLLDNDTNGTQADGSRKTVISVIDGDGVLSTVMGGFERTVVIDGLVLGTLFISDDGFATFTADGADVDKLAHDDIRTWAFTYETTSSTGNLATADATLTIDGQNDQPVAFDVAGTVGEDDSSAAVDTDPDDPDDAGFAPGYTPLSGTAQTFSFMASDIDIGDLLSYEIVSAPTDAFGNQYGSVSNNFDGTFTFDPEDDFQFLEAGESRVVTFEYQVRDDSGVGTSPTSPEETELSATATATITVTGADDADNVFTDNLLFISEDQSQFDTGDALIIDLSDLAPGLDFVGVDWNESFNSTIVSQQTFGGAVLEGIFEGIEAVAQVFADIGCGIANFFGGDCEADVDLPSSITTPGVTVSGSTSGRIGLAPFFSLNSGEVDSEVPVEVVFTTPRQVEAGESFTIGSAYSVDGGATFQTQSPSLRFGVDLVLEAALQAAVNITSSSFGDGTSFQIVPNLDGGAPGFDLDATTNIITFDSTADNPLSSDLLPIPQIFGTEIGFPANTGSILLEIPNISADGTLQGTPDMGDEATISGTGEDAFATLTADLDGIASLLPFVPPFEFGIDEGLTIDVAGASVNLLGFEFGLNLLDVDLINTLSVVQDFSLGIEDLPLVMMFEDGSTITGVSVGDDITVVAPVGFDADTMGDADGLVDFSVDVDMDAVFSNLTTLGFSTELFFGLLSVTGAITSDFFSDFEFSLFDDMGLGSPTNDDFFLSETISLFETDNFATLYENDRFDLEGWEDNPATMDTTAGFYDIA